MAVLHCIMVDTPVNLPVMQLNALQSRLKWAFHDFAQLTAVESVNVCMNYQRLDQVTCHLARQLHDVHGIRPGDIVPLWLARSPSLVVAQLALIRLGAIAAPLDQAAPVARLEAALHVLQPKLVWCDRPLPDLTASLPAVLLTGGDDLSQVPAGACDDSEEAWWPTGPEGAAFVMFTSGSTGVPKGVLVPAMGLEALACSGPLLKLTPDQRWAAWASPSFDAAILELWMPLLNGGCHVVQDVALPDLHTLGQFLRQQRITDALMTTSLFNAMVEDQLGAMGQLQQLLIGGERASVQHVRRFMEAHPGVRLINAYGPTENSVVTLMHEVTLSDIDEQAGIPIGRPMAGHTLCIQPHQGLTDGAGELWVSGVGVGQGYLNNPEQTADRFVHHEGQRWYRTGDQVRQREDGVLMYVGRMDRQVKLQGHRVELDEVELRLGQCPGLSEAVVVVQGDSAENRQLKVFYTCVDGVSVSPMQVRQHLLNELPPAVIPRLYVQLDKMPSLVSGKIDRTRLAQQASSEHADPGTHRQARDTHWQTEHESRLAAIWQSLLPEADIHRQASFVLIGGSSLLAMRVSSLVARQWGRELRPLDVLLNPVLADQAQVMACAPLLLSHDQSPGTVAQLMPDIELTHAQRTLLLASELDPTGAAYLVHVALVLDDRVDWRALPAAFEQLSRKHPMLRVRIQSGGDGWSAKLAPSLPEGWWSVSEQAIDAPSDLQWTPSLLTQVHRSMNLRLDGVMRVRLWPLTGGGHLLVWSMHHACADEESVEMALCDLQALAKGLAINPGPDQWPGLAGLERAWTPPARLDALVADLADRFDTLKPVLPRPPLAGQEVVRELPPALVDGVHRAAGVLGGTPLPILLVAFGMALQATFGPLCRLVSTPFSRRQDPVVADLFTYWLDTRLVEAGARPGEPVAQTLMRVRLALMDAQATEFLPVDQLIESLARSGAGALAASLTQFGFTWRQEPARTLAMGAGQAELIRVPQTAARYGLCLHVAQLGNRLACSLEAGQQAYSEGQVDVVWQAFVQALTHITEIKTELMVPASSVVPMPTMAQPLLDALKLAWGRWLEVKPDSIHADSHFMLSGGSSLVAMRMAAQLRRDLGVVVTLPVFLRHPTFAHLCTLVQAGHKNWPPELVVVGPDTARRLFILIPGYGGHAEGMVKLAKLLQSKLGHDAAVLIVDLDRLCAQAPLSGTLPWLLTRLAGLVEVLPEGQVAGVMGFSLGGLLALALCRQVQGLQTRPVFLLDTCAPRMGRHSVQRTAERQLFRALHWVARRLRPRTTQVWNEAADLEVQHQATLYQRTPKAVWQALEADLTCMDPAAPEVPVHLIQATKTAYLMGLLWRQETRGFVPRQYLSWQQTDLDAAHLDLPRQFAELTAEVVVGSPLVAQINAADPAT